MTHRFAPAVAFSVVLALTVRPSPTFAQPVSARDPAAAEALFQKARPLMEKGKLDEACPIFEESYRLDPAPGTLLNLAACSRLRGKTATAWSQFIEAGRALRRKGDERRAQFADAQAKEVEPLLAYVVIRADKAPPGLVLMRDGAVLSAASLNTKLPVDPGEHVIVANAQGRKTLRTPFNAEARKTTDVVIGELALGDPDPVPAVDPQLAGGPSPGAPADSDGQRARRRVHHIAAFSLGGAGLAALAVGGVFVGLTAAKASDVDDLCPQSRCTTSAAKETLAEATTFANVANGTLIAGGVLLGTGLVVFLTAPPLGDDGEGVSLHIAPSGFSLSARF